MFIMTFCNYKLCTIFDYVWDNLPLSGSTKKYYMGVETPPLRSRRHPEGLTLGAKGGEGDSPKSPENFFAIMLSLKTQNLLCVTPNNYHVRRYFFIDRVLTMMYDISK